MTVRAVPARPLEIIVSPDDPPRSPASPPPPAPSTAAPASPSAAAPASPSTAARASPPPPASSTAAVVPWESDELVVLPRHHANKWLLAAVAGGLVVLAGVETFRCATSHVRPAEKLPIQWTASVASAPPARAIPIPVPAPVVPVEQTLVEPASASPPVSSDRPHPAPAASPPVRHPTKPTHVVTSRPAVKPPPPRDDSSIVHRVPF